MSAMTIRELVTRYQAWAMGYYRKPKTRRPTGEHVQINYATNPLLTTTLPSFRRPSPQHKQLADMPAELMRAEQLDEVRQGMIKANLSRNVINSHISRIRRMFRWAGKAPQRFLSLAVVADLQELEALKKGRSPAVDYGDVQPVSWSHVTDTMAVVSVEVATMIEVAWHTGMRPGELIAMKQSEIMRRPHTSWVYIPAEHKNEHHDQDRMIYIGPEAQAVLTPWLNRIGARDAVWSIKRHTLCNAISRANKKHNIPHWHPNQLRHSCCCRLIEAKNIDAARVVLGHARLATTEIYAKHLKKDQMMASQIMADMG